MREGPPLVGIELVSGGVAFHRATCQADRAQSPTSTRTAALGGENGASTGAFTLFSDGQERDADVAFMESAEATTFRDDALGLRRLNRLFSNLAGAALSEQDTVKLIERIEKER
ncbi:Scr1 family TA system antitoxin-like transcriptional regulator [Streptomyces sp. NPDC050610]|uniref:Scr1 family TA system antitoxin-like transcriptional regulator n=1 Tax=Streptomyces sp. NPDC050610 TaxID=3157097 RepID=UPI00343F39F3